jgi:competence protein ComEA
MDRATAAELDRLPGIGPGIAARIVADRDARGPFGSIDGLQRVKGVGPALAARVQPYVTFSLPPRLSDTEMSTQSGRRRP